MRFVTTTNTTAEPAPTVLAHCPACGVPIYSRAKDERGLPKPEYVCDCRYLAAAAGGHTWPVLPYAPPVPPSPWYYVSLPAGSTTPYFTPSDTHIKAGLG